MVMIEEKALELRAVNRWGVKIEEIEKEKDM